MKDSISDVQKRRDDVLRDLLRNEFHRRADKNPAFSLRALSQKVKIDQSLVTKILQGKRKISSVNAQKIASFLGIYLSEALVGDDAGDSSIAPSSGNTRSSNKAPVSSGEPGAKSFRLTSNEFKAPALLALEYELLKEDEFLVISDWHHFALLELAKTKGFRLEPSYIGSRLGIPVLEASRAVERLKRLGFLQIQGEKFQLQKPNNTWLDYEKTSSARKNLQRKLLAQSTEAIESLGFDRREHSSLVFAVDPKILPILKKKMTEFRRSIDKYSEEVGGATEVYSLCVSLFPLSVSPEFPSVKKQLKTKRSQEKR